MAYGKRDMAMRSLEFMANQLKPHDPTLSEYVEGVCDTDGEGYSDMELGVLFRVCQDFILFCQNK